MKMLPVSKQHKHDKNTTDLISHTSCVAVGLRHDSIVPSSSLVSTLEFFIHTSPFASAERGVGGMGGTASFWPGLINAWIIFTSFHLMEFCFLSASFNHSAWKVPLHRCHFLAHSLSLPFCFSLSLSLLLPHPYLVRCTASWGKRPLLFCIPHSTKQTEEIHSLCLYLHNEWSRCHSSTLAAYWVLGAASLAAWSHRRCQAFQRPAHTMKDKSKERSASMGRATLAVSAFLPLVLEAAAPRPPTLPFSNTWLSNPHPLTLPILL